MVNATLEFKLKELRSKKSLVPLVSRKAYTNLGVVQKIDLIARCFDNYQRASELLSQHWIPISKGAEKGYSFYKQMIAMYNMRQISNTPHSAQILQFHVDLLAAQYICDGSIESVKYIKTLEKQA